MKLNNYSIRMHVSMLTMLPLLLMAISLGSFFLHARFYDLDHDLVMKGQLVARQLAADSEYGVFSNNLTFINGIAENALEQPDVRAVIILDADNKTLAATGKTPTALDQAQESIKTVKASSREGEMPHSNRLLSFVNPEMVIHDNESTVLLYQPILPTQVKLDDFEEQASAQPLGAVIIEMSWEKTHKIKSELLWFTLLATSSFLLITLYLVHLASRRIIEPISKLSSAIQSIGSGKLETRITQEGCINELCTLTTGINQMTADLQHERAVLQQRIDEATLQLRNLAFYDTLTLLPNRRLLNDRITQAMATSKRSGRYGALMFLDLDNFKPLNDQFGHAVGDLLLIEAARRIGSCLREADTVARIGGDEFVVMLCELDVNHAESIILAHKVAEKIRTELAIPYHLDYQAEGQPITKIDHHCTSSIGVALFLNHEHSQEEILNWADVAMYQAKSAGRNQIHFHKNT